MSTKPENTYIGKVHKRLSKGVYREKMYNPLRRGTPDVWYSGPGGDMWIEYKYLPKPPKKALIDPKKLLSPLQVEWLKARKEEGRNVAIVIGSPNGGVFLQGAELFEPFEPELLKCEAEWIAKCIEQDTL